MLTLKQKLHPVQSRHGEINGRVHRTESETKCLKEDIITCSTNYKF